MSACEFKIPTTPSLPAKWNSKLILPLIDKSYSFADLIDTESGNPIAADTTGILQYSLADSTIEPIEIDPISFRIVPAQNVNYTFDMRKKVQRNPDSTVKVITHTLKKAWDDTNNRIAFGVLDNSTGNSTDGTPINAIILTAQLSDSFPNPIRIRIIAHNFHENPGQAVVLDSLDLAADSLLNDLTIALDGDSLIGGSLTAEIDSLELDIEVQVLERLAVAVSRLNQKLTVTLSLGELHMSSFYGRVFASGEVPPTLIAKSLSGASGIEFDSAWVNLETDVSGGTFDSVYFKLSGKKIHGPATACDTTTGLAGADFGMDISPVMSNLPDTIRVYVKAMSLPGTFFQSTVFTANVDVKYSLTVPLKFIIPPALTLASGNTTTYFIKDSTTRARIITSQEGADLDLSVENHTQLQGNLYFLISNFNFFPFDTLDNNLPDGFIANNDTIWHLGDDTTLVYIDTLAVLEFPAARFEGNTLITPGIKNQTFQTSADAIALLADTCYFKPYFQLINPDTSQTTMTETQKIQVKGYLNLFFDAAVLNDSE